MAGAGVDLDGQHDYLEGRPSSASAALEAEAFLGLQMLLEQQPPHHHRRGHHFHHQQHSVKEEEEEDDDVAAGRLLDELAHSTAEHALLLGNDSGDAGDEDDDFGKAFSQHSSAQLQEQVRGVFSPAAFDFDVLQPVGRAAQRHPLADLGFLSEY
jgi:hypothetical protein